MSNKFPKYFTGVLGTMAHFLGNSYNVSGLFFS
jgi:hypothetical protein